MSARRRVTVVLDGRIAVLRGWRVADLIAESGCRAVFSGTAGGWMVDRHRVGDVLAYLAARNIPVTVLDDADERASTVVDTLSERRTPWSEPEDRDPMDQGGLW